MFSRKSSKDFWASVKRTTRLKTTLKASVIDGVRGDYNIAELWASKLKDLLNTNHNDWRDFSQLINGHISFASLSELSVTPVDVRRSLQNLKTGKKMLIILVLTICVMLPLLLLNRLQHCLHPF